MVCLFRAFVAIEFTLHEYILIQVDLGDATPE
jgi:hypothetical protein